MGAACSNQDAVRVSSPYAREPSASINNKKGKSSIFSSSTTDSDSEAESAGTAPRPPTRPPTMPPTPPQPTPPEEPPPPPPSALRKPQPGEVKIPTLMELFPEFRRMMVGRTDAQAVAENKVVVVYHMSLFCDSQVERSVLLEKVYPEITLHCLQKGFELQVVDLSWGLKDQYSYGHGIQRMAGHILPQLAQRDKECILTVFLNEKYGCYWCPLVVDMESFQGILKKVTEDNKNFLEKWYLLDETLQTPAYALQSVEKCIPKYKEDSKEAYKEGYREWEKEMIRLRNVLSQAASPEFQKQYMVSALETQMEEFLFANRWAPENIIWMRRKFKKLDLDCGSGVLADFVDMSGENFNENAQARLKNLCNKLTEKVTPENKVETEVQWAGTGLDGSVPEHAQYLDSVCQKYKDVLKDAVDRIMTKKLEQDRKKTKLVHRALTKSLHSDLLHNTLLCQQLCDNFVGQNNLIEQLENYVTQGHTKDKVEKIHPLVVHGGPGSGKSSVAAVLANNFSSLSGWNNGICVLRFVGASVETETEDQLVQSIAEQACILCQMPLSVVHRKLDPALLQNLIKQLPTGHPTLIIVDGLDGLKHDGTSEPQFDWLPTQLPGHVRMCITVPTGSRAHGFLQQHLPPDSEFLQVQALDPVYAELLLAQTLNSCNRILTEDLRDRILDACKENACPLSLKLAATFVDAFWEVGAEKWLPACTSLEDQICFMLDQLDEKYGVTIVGKMCTYLKCSRHGLSDLEMTDLLSCDEDVLSSVYSFWSPEICRVPTLLWEALKKNLAIFLRVRTSNGLPLYSIGSQCFCDVVASRYDLMEASTQTGLRRYFENRQKDKQTENGEMGETNDCRKALLLKPQPIKYDESYNRRLLDELPLHLFRTGGDFSELVTKCLFDWSWLLAKLTASSLAHVLEDVKLALTLAPDSDSVLVLKGFLLEHAKIIIQDPQQFPTYLYNEVEMERRNIWRERVEYMSNLYDVLKKDVIPQLVAVNYELGMEKVQEEEEGSQPKPILTAFFRITGDDSHVISVAPATGKLQVWNIFTQEAIRTLTGLDEPKDVKLCNSVTAVILCSRELKIYNLDEGTLLCELKGVLNIRMPYYGIHSKDYTIALARNRMYLNLMDNSTGDMEATFKVGEDRFLNSLLVSENGEVCVCGDAVQKPFPLLVWDLPKRKLVYDLRIQGHEFVTRIAAISNDGHYVASVCKELEDPDPNFLIVYDLQSGSVFKKWKPDFSVTALAINSKAGTIASAQEDGTVSVWDLVSGGQRCTLTGHSRGADRISMDDAASRAVSWDSTRRDPTVWMWDLKQGKSLGCFSAPLGVSCCEISPDGSTVLVGLLGCDHLVALHPPGGAVPPDHGVYGDASRRGLVFDLENAKAQNCQT